MTTLAEILLAESTLPPKPLDADGRYVAWVRVVQAGPLHYGGRVIQVDDAFLEAQLSQHESLTSDGYKPPVLREHTPNGEREGDVLALARTTVDGKDTLVAAVASSDPDFEAKVKARKIRYFSPSFASFEDERGIKYELVLSELSLVSKPHQKGLGSTHVLAGETMDYKEEKPLEGPSLDDRIARLEAMVEDLVKASAPKMEEDEEESEETPVEMAEIVKLRTELEAEKRRRRLADFRSDYKAGATVVLSETLVEDLFELSETKPKAWAALKGSASLPSKGTTATPPRRTDFVDWGQALGSSEGNGGGGVVELSELDDDALMDALKEKHKGDRSLALAEFGTLRYGGR